MNNYDDYDYDDSSYTDACKSRAAAWLKQAADLKAQAAAADAKAARYLADIGLTVDDFNATD